MGTYLLGDGRGGFNPVNNIESGLNVNGEVRDIILLEQNDKGRLLVFEKNNSALQVYKVKG